MESKFNMGSMYGKANPYIGIAESAYSIYQNNPYRSMSDYIKNRNYNEPSINNGSLYLNNTAYGDMFSDVGVMEDNIKGNFGRDIGQGAKLGASIGAATGNPLLGAGLGAVAGVSMGVGKRIDDIEFGDSKIANIGEGIAKLGATGITGPIGWIGRGIRRKREKEAKKAFNTAKSKQIKYLDNFTNAQESLASQNNAMDRYKAIQQQYRSPDSIYL